MKLFVTGGSGFIGAALVERLARTHAVRAMARTAAAATTVTARGAEPVACDLETVAARDLAGSGVVVHCAALVADWAPRGEFERVNVRGTAHLLRVAREAGVRRFVYVSSDSVLFAGADVVEADEETPYPHSKAYPYAVSKRRAEQLVRAANGTELETVCVRPVLVWGPGDTSILPELVAMVDKGAWLWVDGGRHLVSTTHVDNVVQGTVLAMERGRPGGVYFLTDGPPISHREFFSQYLATARRFPGTRSLPGSVVKATGTALETMWRLAAPRSRPPLSREAAATLAATITVSSDRAVSELGFSPRSREGAMAALAQGTPR